MRIGRPRTGHGRTFLVPLVATLAVAPGVSGCADDEPPARSSPAEGVVTPASETTRLSPLAADGAADGATASTPSGTRARVTSGTSRALAPRRPTGRSVPTFVAPCGTAHLVVSAGRVDAGAGQRHLPIVFRNTGSTTCTLSGFPEVQGFSVDAAPVVTATHETGTPVSTVTLAVGEAASSVVRATTVPDGDKPCLPDFRFLYVTPPGQTSSATVKVELPACGGLRVRAIVPGPTGQ